MRWALPLLLFLAGCFGPGCWDDGRAGSWTEPGLFATLVDDPDWDLTSVEPDLNATETGGLGVPADWTRTERKLAGEQRIWYVERGPVGRIGGIVHADGGAEAVEAFTAELLGLAVDGEALLEAGRPDDRFLLVSGELEARPDLQAFLERPGVWRPVTAGRWDYQVGQDSIEVAVDVVERLPDGAWDPVRVDAADRVLGVYVDGESVTDEQLQDAARGQWTAWGLEPPTFQGFGHEAQTICT